MCNIEDIKKQYLQMWKYCRQVFNSECRIMYQIEVRIQEEIYTIIE